MPWKEEWVAPEKFLVHDGVNIYHTYNDDDLDQGSSNFWFTTSEADNDTDFQFDVRDLKTRSRDRLDDERPAFLTVDNFPTQAGPDYDAADAYWKVWHDSLKLEICRAIIVEAIDLGLLIEPDVELKTEI